MPRFYVDMPFIPGSEVLLPESAARHVQVLRLQPGDALTLFNGQSAAHTPLPSDVDGNVDGDGEGKANSHSEGEYAAVVTQMGRRDVSVRIGEFLPAQREAQRPLHIAIGMPANDRMDWLVEKAAELGAASIAPLMCERSVLRLDGERADKKAAHWRGIATAACEQSGRCRVLHIHPPQRLAGWLAALPPLILPTDSSAGIAIREEMPAQRWLLSLQAGSTPLRQLLAGVASDGLSAGVQAFQASQPLQGVVFLSGPEGGFSPAEEAAARHAGFTAVWLGPRVLRSETAPLAVLAALDLW